MRFFFVVFVAFTVSGCYAASMEFQSGSLNYEANGLNGPTPMEAASAVATVEISEAQAEAIRAQARTMEDHPELFYGWGVYGGYGRGRVDGSYYYPPHGSSPASDPALETRATGLEGQATELEHRATTLEEGLRGHLDPSYTPGGGGQ